MKTIINFRFFLLALLSVFLFTSCEKDPAEDMSLKSTATISPVIINEGASVSVDLIAGQNTIAGNVSVTFDKDFVHVKYTTINGWMLDEAHLWVGSNLSMMPQTNSGNPKPGLFPYKSGLLYGATSYSFSIPWSDFGGYEANCGNILYMAAHAALHKMNSNGSVNSQTGWGNGSQINDNGSWAMYFSLQFECGSTNDPETNCQTAFGFGPLTFVDAGLTPNRWGWIYTLNAEGYFTTPLYAGAGNNDIQHATNVGNVTYSLSGSSLVVHYETFTGYSLSETHVYASTTFPTTIAPGQFNYSHAVQNPHSDTYTIELNGATPVYLISHAVVCSE